MKVNKKYIIAVPFLLLILSCSEQYPQISEVTTSENQNNSNNVSPENNFQLFGFSYITGYMISHAKEVINLRGLNPRSYELNLNWHLNNDEVWNDCHCYPRIGVFAAIHDFENEKVLGYGFSGGLSFTYFFGLPSDYNFHLKGKAGVSYLTKPFDREKHPDNMAYATHINYLISIGTGITIKLIGNFEMQLEGSIIHQSNAALLEPNGGINYWAASLSTNYFLSQPVFNERNISDPYFATEKMKRWDLSFSWGISSMPYPMPGQVPMYGITILRSLQFSRIACLSFGAELERNGRAVEINRRISPGKDVDPLRASLLVGVEFLMGSAILSAQIGGYFHRPFVEKDDFYQRWGLVYNIYKNIYAGLNFKSYRNSADHLSLRITYTL
ncbi:MAG: acyloxyacyl hydrolase [Ignavibacteria bacterium]|nr:acyloxyacyl hydrolase [Ignavibacteria bacterium]